MELRKRDESPRKEFVGVHCFHSPEDGSVTPVSFVRESGAEYHIDKVLDVRRAASLRAGGAGQRYTVRFFVPEAEKSMTIYLFHDDRYWFIEVNCG